MKKYILLIIAAVAVTFSACQTASEELFDLDFDRVFTPTTLEAVPSQTPSTEHTPWQTLPTVMELTTRFEWAASPNVIHYRLQISTSANFETLIIPELTIPGTAFEIPSALAPDRLPWSTAYFVRVQAIGPDDLRAEDSRWNTLSFSTPGEQLFHTPVRADIGSSFANFNWYPGSTATHLVLRGPLGNILPGRSIPITQAQESFLFENLDIETEHTVQIMDGSLVRGQLQFSTRRGVNCLEDNVLCFPEFGDDPVQNGLYLVEIMENPANINRIIYLPEGFVANIPNNIDIAGSMHIFGSYDGARPLIRFGATHGEGIDHAFIRLLPGATVESIILENIEIMGVGPSNYILNENPGVGLTTRIGTLKLDGVFFHDLGGNAVRLRNSHMDRLIVTDSEFYRMGLGSTFAFINLNDAGASLQHIEIRNSTFANMRNSFFNGQGVTATAQVANSITIENSTFDRVVGDPGTVRRFFIDGGVLLAGQSLGQISVTIRNSIFGSTFDEESDMASGIRMNSAIIPTVENSFRTDGWATVPTIDNFDLPGLERVASSREDLFRNPDARDFTIIPPGAVRNAGDPRWRPATP